MQVDSLEYRSKFLSICTNGKNVENPYTGQLIYVPCGVCPACLMKKSSEKTIQLKAQEKVSKYCYMVTLTYSNKFIPKMVIDSYDDYHVLKSLPRLDKDGSPVKGLSNDMFDFGVYCSSADMLDFRMRANLSADGKYPKMKRIYSYCDYRDFQLFMKRFRKQLFKLVPYETLYTYTVSEYGTKRLRSHFHFLLFFDSDKIPSVLGKCLLSSWKYGRVDWTLSRGKCSSYLAGYLNSFTRLPGFVRDSSQIKPRSRFSNNFGKKLFESFISDAKEGNFVPFLDGRSFTCSGKRFVYYPRRSYIHSAFFPYASNTRRTLDELFDIVESVRRTLSFVQRATRNFDREPQTPLAYAKCLYYLLSNSSDLDDFLANNYYINLFLIYAHSSDISFNGIDFLQERDTLRFYRLISCVHRFFKFWNISLFNGKNIDFSIVIKRALRISQDFYNFRDSYNLKRSYEYFQNYCEDISDLDVYLSPSEKTTAIFKNSRLGKDVANYNLQRSKNRIKHREINELVGKFEYE